MRARTQVALKAVAGTLVALFVGAIIFVCSGIYDVAATEQHTKPVYWLTEFVMQRSVQLRSHDVQVPDLTRPEMIARGFLHYRDHCVQCHGGPGVAPDATALGMTPVPANLIPTTHQWNAAKFYWVVKHGIKMTGMPAWAYRMTDAEIWEVVAFVKERLPYLTPREFRSMVADSANVPAADSWPSTPPAVAGDAQAGRRAIDQHGCATCHIVPGITGATRQVGPPLTGIASRSYIAGVLQNSPENMVRWLMGPTHVRPVTAMPDLRIREQHARDIAAYLGTLRAD